MSLKSRFADLTAWFCWKAWDYARRRELKRRGWNPDTVVPETDETASPQQRQIVAADAKQLLDNRHFVEAFAAVHAHIELKAHSCDPADKDVAQRIIVTKQLLQAVRREIIRKLEDGYMAEIQIDEMERKKKLLRFVR